MMRAGAVALAGTMPAMGENGMAAKKQIATMTPTQPVRPPTPTPAPDSMYVVAEDDDTRPPPTAASESMISGRLTWCRLPSLSR